MFPTIFLSGEFTELKQSELLWSNSNWIAMTITGVVGFIMNIAVFLQIKFTSPLTNNISGTLKVSLSLALSLSCSLSLSLSLTSRSLVHPPGLSSNDNCVPYLSESHFIRGKCDQVERQMFTVWQLYKRQWYECVFFFVPIERCWNHVGHLWILLVFQCALRRDER